MNLITHTDAPTFDAGGTAVVGYAAPSRGAAEVSLWQIELAPGSTSPRHHMDREEVFLGLEGQAIAEVGGIERAELARPEDPGQFAATRSATETGDRQVVAADRTVARRAVFRLGAAYAVRHHLLSARSEPTRTCA